MLHQKFINGLKKIGLTEDEVIKYFIYAGGSDEGSELLSYNDEHNLYYGKHFSHIKEPNPKDKCICGHDIIFNLYILDTRYNKLYIIGSKCINQFIGGKRCFKCNSKHRNRVSILCNQCRKISKCITCKKEYDYKFLGDRCRDCLNLLLNNTMQNIKQNILFINDKYVKVNHQGNIRVLSFT